jgi:hypothetical protein
MAGSVDRDTLQVTAFEICRFGKREAARADSRSLRRSEQASTEE